MNKNTAVWSLLVGLSMSWVGWIAWRASLDARAPWIFAEAWIAFAFFGMSVWRCWRAVKGPSLHPVRQYLVLGSSAFAGLALGFVWFAQTAVKQAEWTTEERFNQTEHSLHPISVALETGGCGFAKKYLVDLTKSSWKMSVFEKVWIKETAVKWHQKKCLSSDDVFSIVQMLRYSPTSKLMTPSAMTGFYIPGRVDGNYDSIAKHLLPFSEKSWCEIVFSANSKESPQKNCSLLSTKPISSVPDWDTL